MSPLTRPARLCRMHQQSIEGAYMGGLAHHVWHGKDFSVAVDSAARLKCQIFTRWASWEDLEQSVDTLATRHNFTFCKRGAVLIGHIDPVTLEKLSHSLKILAPPHII